MTMVVAKRGMCLAFLVVLAVLVTGACCSETPSTPINNNASSTSDVATCITALLPNSSAAARQRLVDHFQLRSANSSARRTSSPPKGLPHNSQGSYPGVDDPHPHSPHRYQGGPRDHYHEQYPDHDERPPPGYTDESWSSPHGEYDSDDEQEPSYSAHHPHRTGWYKLPSSGTGVANATLYIGYSGQASDTGALDPTKTRIQYSIFSVTQSPTSGDGVYGNWAASVSQRIAIKPNCLGPFVVIEGDASAPTKITVTGVPVTEVSVIYSSGHVPDDFKVVVTPATVFFELDNIVSDPIHYTGTVGFDLPPLSLAELVDDEWLPKGGLTFTLHVTPASGAAGASRLTGMAGRYQVPTNVAEQCAGSLFPHLPAAQGVQLVTSGLLESLLPMTALADKDTGSNTPGSTASARQAAATASFWPYEACHDDHHHHDDDDDDEEWMHSPVMQGGYHDAPSRCPPDDGTNDRWIKNRRLCLQQQDGCDASSSAQYKPGLVLWGGILVQINGSTDLTQVSAHVAYSAFAELRNLPVLPPFVDARRSFNLVPFEGEPYIRIEGDVEYPVYIEMVAQMVPFIQAMGVGWTEPVFDIDFSRIEFIYITPCGTPLKCFGKLIPAVTSFDWRTLAGNTWVPRGPVNIIADLQPGQPRPEC